jgi:dipeptidyl aminopeptidase/acylaminoacyl peptidase
MLARILAFVLLFPVTQSSSDLPLTVERYLEIKRLSDIAVSSDGAHVAFTATAADTEANEYRMAVYVWLEGRTRPVAGNFSNAFGPRWSPDGTRLAFLAAGRQAGAGPESTRLWMYRLSSGIAAAPLGDLQGDVVEYAWAPDNSIYALMTSDAGDREFWKISVADDTAEYVWGGGPGVRDMAISPDGQTIAFSSNGAATNQGYSSYDLRLLDLGSKRTRELTNRPGSEIAAAWSPDGSTIVFRAPQTPAQLHSQSDLFAVDVARGGIRNLTGSFDRSVLAHRWAAGGDLLFTAAIGTETHLFALRAGGPVELISGEHYHIGDFEATNSGATIYAVRESATEAAELWRLSSSGTDKLTRLNEVAHDWRLGNQKIISWRAPDGLNVEGLLIYPTDYEVGQRYPLLVDADGGPSNRVLNVLHQPSAYQLFAAQGYAILAVNYRGSDGYGAEFASAPRRGLAGGDFVDLTSGVDHVIDLGIADPGRIAILGGARSAYGAHLATWCITQTSRFKAAVAFYDVPAALPLTGAPADLAKALMAGGYLEIIEGERQPLDSITNVRTPLLLFEGAATSLISRPQRLYNALNELRKTVELADVAGTGDRWTPRDRTEVFFRQLRWFDKYLKFNGADLFDFYLVGEWVPGPGGWQLRVDNAVPRADYSGLQPSAGRYLEIALTLEPSEAALREGTLQDFQLDPGSAIALLGPDSTARPFAGTVTQLFERETLVMGLPSPIRVMATGPAGAPTALATRLAFEVPEAAGEYRLRVTGFVPVRIWVAGGN